MRTIKVGIVGSGVVGRTLADGFLADGHEVRCASREPEKLAQWKEAGGPRASVGNFKETALFGDVVVLAVKGTAAEEAVGLCGAENLAGRIVIDATNPIVDVPPRKGVLQFFTRLDDSLMERLQRVAPRAHFVKAFSSVGAALMVRPDFGGVRPTMFICGENLGAKEQVRVLLDSFGWDAEDMGGVEAARAIEPLCMLWCIPGFLRNEWSHAFKLLKRS